MMDQILDIFGALVKSPFDMLLGGSVDMLLNQFADAKWDIPIAKVLKRLDAKLALGGVAVSQLETAINENGLDDATLEVSLSELFAGRLAPFGEGFFSKAGSFEVKWLAQEVTGGSTKILLGDVLPPIEVPFPDLGFEIIIDGLEETITAISDSLTGDIVSTLSNTVAKALPKWAEDLLKKFFDGVSKWVPRVTNFEIQDLSFGNLVKLKLPRFVLAVDWMDKTTRLSIGLDLSVFLEGLTDFVKDLINKFVPECVVNAMCPNKKRKCNFNTVTADLDGSDEANPNVDSKPWSCVSKCDGSSISLYRGFLGCVNKYSEGHRCLLNNQCLSGNCKTLSKKCSSLAGDGKDCDRDYNCKSGWCKSGKCKATVGLGDACSGNDNECASGVCESSSSTCITPKADGEACSPDGPTTACTGGYCSSAVCGSIKDDGEACTTDGECASGFCDSGTSVCATPGGFGDACTANRDCDSELCDVGDTNKCIYPEPTRRLDHNARAAAPHRRMLHVTDVASDGTTTMRSVVASVPPRSTKVRIHAAAGSALLAAAATDSGHGWHSAAIAAGDVTQTRVSVRVTVLTPPQRRLATIGHESPFLTLDEALAPGMWLPTRSRSTPPMRAYSDAGAVASDDEVEAVAEFEGAELDMGAVGPRDVLLLEVVLTRGNSVEDAVVVGAELYHMAALRLAYRDCSQSSGPCSDTITLSDPAEFHNIPAALGQHSGREVAGVDAMHQRCSGQAAGTLRCSRWYQDYLKGVAELDHGHVSLDVLHL